MLVSCLAYSFNLKMEAIISSETSIDFHRTTKRYIPEERILDIFVLVHAVTNQFLTAEEHLHTKSSDFIPAMLFGWNPVSQAPHQRS
jgi:hypothetical protein